MIKYNRMIKIRYFKEGIRIKNKIGMSLPELTPLESKSLDHRRIRKKMLNKSGLV
jgi:hypothetical protein